MEQSTNSPSDLRDIDEMAYVAQLRTCLSWSDATARGILFFMGAPAEFVDGLISEPLQWIEEVREENTDLEALRDSLNSDTVKEIVTHDDKTRERFFRAFEYRALQSIAHSVGSSKAAYELLDAGMVFRASICVLKAQEFLNIASGELTHRDGSFLAGKLRDLDPKESGGIGAVKRWGFNRPHRDFVLDQWARDASSYASKADFAREMSDLLRREHKVSILPDSIADTWLKGKQHPRKSQPDEAPE